MLNHTRTNHLPTLATLLLLAAVASIALSACHLPAGTGESAPAPRPTTPYYNKEHFHRSEGRFTYDDGTFTATRTGVDVSDYQGPIDWERVAQDGISFAFLRIGFRGNTEGGLYADEYFSYNLEEARAAGIACGAYFFSQATSVREAEEEAQFVLDLLGGTYLDCPVAFDFEIERGSRIATVSDETATQVARAFTDVIRAGGYEPMLYGNTFDLNRYDESLLDSCSLWCAEYDDGPSCVYKSYFWQYSNQGVVSGINEFCDLNLYLGDLP